MKFDKGLIEELSVHSAQPARLDDRSVESMTRQWLGTSKNKYKKVAEEDLRFFVDELTDGQQSFWANGTHALLIILQAIDAAGKDGTIRHVMSGVNPQGCQVETFKQPSAEELDHDFLWQLTSSSPGENSVSGDGSPANGWGDRFEDINALERHLHRNGARIVKLFPYLSRGEEKATFLKRLDDPAKNWKLSANDLAERKRWDEYQAAYEEALSATSSPWAPRYVVPSDHKYALRVLVGGIGVNTIDEMEQQPPQLDGNDTDALARAKNELLAE